MADLLSNDMSGSGNDTGSLDNAAVAKSLVGTQKPSFTWEDLVKLAQMHSTTQLGGTAPLSGGSLFGGYRQNVPIAQPQSIPDVQEKKSDQGLDWLMKAFGGGSAGGASFTGGGAGAPIT